MEEYDKIRRVGEGTYGSVLKCRDKSTGAFVAIKVFKETEDDPIVRKTIAREVRALKSLENDHVVRLLDMFRKGNKLALVFEFVETTLLEEIERAPGNNGLSLDCTKRFLWQTLKAVNFLHENQIVHRDIKPENILLSRNGVVKICDFGFARLLSKTNGAFYTEYVSTRWYRAPELLIGDTHYGKTVDIWAIGCLLPELLTGRPLFAGESDVDQLHKIVKFLGPLPKKLIDFYAKSACLTPAKLTFNHSDGHVRRCLDFYGMPMKIKNYEEFIFDFLNGCFAYIPEERASSKQLMKLDLFQTDAWSGHFENELEGMVALEKEQNRILDAIVLRKLKKKRNSDEGLKSSSHSEIHVQKKFGMKQQYLQPTKRHLEHQQNYGNTQKTEQKVGDIIGEGLLKNWGIGNHEVPAAKQMPARNSGPKKHRDSIDTKKTPFLPPIQVLTISESLMPNLGQFRAISGSLKEIKSRQNNLLQNFIPESDAICIQLGSRLRYQSENIFYRFAQNSNFLYLTGLSEADSALIVVKRSGKLQKSILFTPSQSNESILWNGWGVDKNVASTIFGSTHHATIDGFGRVLESELENIHRATNQPPNVYCDIPVSGKEAEKFLHGSAHQHLAWPSFYEAIENGRSSPNSPWESIRNQFIKTNAKVKQLSPTLHRQRLFKSQSDIENMRRAAKITALGFDGVFSSLGNDGVDETCLETVFECTCKKHGADGVAYVPVVAGSGDNACIIHYVKNSMPVKHGDLILMDAGAKVNGFAADVTRTFPSTGKFTLSQRRLYEALLSVQKDIIKQCDNFPGITLDSLYQSSVSMICDRICRDLFKLKSSDAEDLVKKIYPHHIGHHLGMDVHDCPEAEMGSIPSKERQQLSWSPNVLLPKMVITVEPGVYIPSNIDGLDRYLFEKIPSDYRGIGIRIEDNILINDGSPADNLTKEIPKDVEDIEKAIRRQ